MAGKAATVQITERQFEILERIVASRTAAVRLVQRAKIVLLAFAKQNNEEISEIVGLDPQQASVWRKRWRGDWKRLISIECNEPALIVPVTRTSLASHADFFLVAMRELSGSR